MIVVPYPNTYWVVDEYPPPNADHKGRRYVFLPEISKYIL